MNLPGTGVLPRLVLLAVTATPLTSCTSAISGDEGSPGASCAAVIVYEGNRYRGHGDLRRDPALTGRHVTGTLPACDDTGGRQQTEDPERVEVEELVDVPLATAFRWNDTILIREGRELPPATRTWFAAPRCSTRTPFRVVADWLGVTGPRKARFDGDIRPPYVLDVHVTQGPAEYVGTTISVHADATTRPRLGPQDVKDSL
jgi:hypothetical protein